MQYYTIFGQKVGSHILSMAVLGATFAGSALAMGGKKEQDKQGPPINAQSKEEEEFIQNFIKEAEKEDKAGKEKATQ